MRLNERLERLEAKRNVPEYRICFVNHSETLDEALRREKLGNISRANILFVSWMY